MARLSLFPILLIFSALFCITTVNAEESPLKILTAENFESSWEDRSTSWLVSFYAPWCHHCKKLEPILEEVAKATTQYDNVHIGKLEATKYKDIADKLGVDRFPTILYKKEGFIGKYHGSRDFGSLKRFIERMHEPSYRHIETISELRHGSHTLHNVTFVLTVAADCRTADIVNQQGNKKCSKDEETLQQQFIEISRKHQFHASFAFLIDPSSLSPITHASTLCKYESTEIDEEQLYCLNNLLSPPSLATNTAANTDAIATPSFQDAAFFHQRVYDHIDQFIEKNNFPLMSELENHNFKLFSHMNKTMIIGVVDYTRKEKVEHIVSLLTNIARNKIPSDQKDQYIFGYLDGSRWKTFIRHHHGKVPSILIVDHDDGRHANFPLNQDIQSYENKLNEFVDLLINNRLEFVETVPPGLIQKIRHRFETYYPWSLILIILPVLLLGASIFMFPKPEIKKVKRN